ncbi:hypothetical protein CONPUDRAFT_127627 [Coniophora puteana RWD-64-598 SS2]|uniref:NCS1 nucleoside transporter family n=1 Tax=Coniophora puteana (strain RWD-64-598) TaxID=741705 RepID=A0A5M3MG60_CONPW|nr:uncharacterized protein CONPUDRAFT_127627 [Coniophora puteana RWD-64-598 SS2]EIW78153.1 hypothetical protein CONPUDRAFT_127627 [Coniophora puteana RWD-64-598 SS2]
MLKYCSLSRWALETEGASLATRKGWSNKDMDPVPPHGRTLIAHAQVSYWVSDATNLAVWELAGSMLSLGLSWRQALPAIAVAYSITSVVTVINGTTGARLHVAFPVLNRSSFGFWFSYFPVLIRVIIAMFWYGIQTYNGSLCVYQMLKAIWPSTARLPNHLSTDATITSTGAMCYIIYWTIQLPFMLLSPQKLRWLFMVKSTLTPITWLAMVIWSFIRVPSNDPGGLFNQHSTLSGSALTWTWLNAMNSALGLYCGLAVNIPDFTRYAKNERAQYIQPIIMPIVFTFCSFAGMAVTSAGITLYGDVLWNPLDLIDRWDNRAAAFFTSFVFALTTIGTNISTNSMGCGNDMTAIFPKYINIRRGQIICAIIGGWALCPWQILANATGFLTFLDGWTIFFGPFAGVMVTDFWLVHKGQVDVPAMYDPHGRYRYTAGVNWRAVLTMLIAIVPTLPGLAKSINTTLFVGEAPHLYDISWMYGFFVSCVVYYSLSLIFPPRGTFVDELVECSTDDLSAFGRSQKDGSQSGLPTEGEEVFEGKHSDTVHVKAIEV